MPELVRHIFLIPCPKTVETLPPRRDPERLEEVWKPKIAPQKPYTTPPQEHEQETQKQANNATYEKKNQKLREGTSYKNAIQKTSTETMP